jgi:cysteine desulfurase
LSLDLKGIAVSSGSACTSGSLQASHVLEAMNVDPILAQGSIRFSMGRFTTKEQLDYTISVLPEIINRLRGMSAAYDKPN